VDIALWVKVLYICTMSITYQPNRRKRAKTHGFITRTKTETGRKVTQARRRKGRASVSIKK
jgi:large subunit ribosomal protein L34